MSIVNSVIEEAYEPIYIKQFKAEDLRAKVKKHRVHETCVSYINLGEISIGKNRFFIFRFKLQFARGHLFWSTLYFHKIS